MIITMPPPTPIEFAPEAVATIARNIRDNMEDIHVYGDRTLHYHQGFSVQVIRLNATTTCVRAIGITETEFQPILDVIDTVDR